MKKNNILLIIFSIILLGISFVLFQNLAEKMEKQEMLEDQIKIIEDSLTDKTYREKLDSFYIFDQGKIK